MKNCFFILLCLVFVGCNNKTPHKTPDSLVFVKFDEGIRCLNYYNSNNNLTYQKPKDIDTVSITDFIVPQSINYHTVKRLSESENVNFIKFITAFCNQFYRNFRGSNYNSVYDYTENFDDKVYIVGKLKITESIDSYLFLMESPGLGYSTTKEYYLFNYRDDILKSVVMLSIWFNGLDGGVTINSYLKKPIYFPENFYYFSQIKSLSNETDIGCILPEKEYSQYFTEDYRTEVLYYSLFLIDKNGYIKFLIDECPAPDDF